MTLSMLERSLSYEIFDYRHNAAVLGFNPVKPPHSSSSSTVQMHPEVFTAVPAASTSTEINFSGGIGEFSLPESRSGGGGVRRKRRRSKRKNEKEREEKEKQRMKHIAVERKRRRQMNDHLSVLKSMMPSSYAQRGDQASIVGGFINFLKDLEQLLHSLEAKRTINTHQSPYPNTNSASIFSDFFSFPQFSPTSSVHHHHRLGHCERPMRAVVAEVEVTMVESHANIKFLTKAQSINHFKMVKELQSLGLSILHFNLTTCKHMALYTLSVKVEDACQMTSVNEIASAMHELVRRLQEEI